MRSQSMVVVGTALLLVGAALAMSATPTIQPPAAATDSSAGRLLVATPKIHDPRFMRTVIYVVRHDSTGAMGFVLNRPMVEVPLARLLAELGIESEGVGGTIRMHYGGPVERSRGFLLHTADYQEESTQVIRDGVALSGQPEVWRALAAGKGPRRSLFVLGYSGWGSGQLESEIRAGHWVVVPAEEDLVFDDDYDGKWPRAMARLKINL